MEHHSMIIAMCATAMIPRAPIALVCRRDLLVSICVASVVDSTNASIATVLYTEVYDTIDVECVAEMAPAVVSVKCLKTLPV